MMADAPSYDFDDDDRESGSDRGRKHGGKVIKTQLTEVDQTLNYINMLMKG